MLIFCYNINVNDVDNAIESLMLEDIINVYYDAPLNITVDEWGYGYEEQSDVIVTLKVAYTEQDGNVQEYKKKVSKILNLEPSEVIEENDTYDDFNIPPISINEEWILASPQEEIIDKNKISFISQGAFGTGLHETTQDILRVILSKDFSNCSVLDIGTGSGILSIAAALKGAKKVTAIDIRDVSEEVLLNASLNSLENIEVIVGDAISGEIQIKDNYEWIFINIGGEETLLFMDFIKNKLKPKGSLLISGLVEWSKDLVIDRVIENGFEVIESYQTNEWCTIILKSKV